MPLLNEATERAREAANDRSTPISDQDRVELMAHQLLPVVVGYQRLGRPEFSEQLASKPVANAWLHALNLAEAGFEKKFGRPPKATVEPVGTGERGPQLMSSRAKDVQESVERVRAPSLFGKVEIKRPRDPRKRRPLVEAIKTQGAGLIQATRAPAQQIARREELADVPAAGIPTEALKKIGKAAWRASMGLVMIPGHIVGVVTQQEFDRWLNRGFRTGSTGQSEAERREAERQAEE